MWNLGIVLLPNFLGFGALFAYVFTLLPSGLKVVFPAIKKAGGSQFL
ncbi:hypothetical protein [Nostoc sp.]